MWSLSDGQTCKRMSQMMADDTERFRVIRHHPRTGPAPVSEEPDNGCLRAVVQAMPLIISSVNSSVAGLKTTLKKHGPPSSTITGWFFQSRYSMAQNALT